MPEIYTLDQLKESYLQHLLLKGFTAFTLRQNEQMIRVFLNFLKVKSITEIKKITLETLEEYKGYLNHCQNRKGKPFTISTVLTRLLAVKSFLKFLYKKNIIWRDITESWQMPKDKKALPSGIMTLKEIRLVLKQPKIRTVLGYRDRTILEILYSTGIRAGELTRLKVADVDLEKKLLRITLGKGNKGRVVPLNTPTCKFLARYLKKIRPKFQDKPRTSGNNWEKRAKTGEGILFLTVYNGAFTQGGLTVIMKKYLKLAGITKKIQPCHGFRHSVATHLLEDGMDIRYVQAFLGHETIQTTQVYTHVEKQKLREMLKKYHPRERNHLGTFQRFNGEKALSNVVIEKEAIYANAN